MFNKDDRKMLDNVLEKVEVVNSRLTILTKLPSDRESFNILISKLTAYFDVFVFSNSQEATGIDPSKFKVRDAFDVLEAFREVFYKNVERYGEIRALRNEICQLQTKIGDLEGRAAR